MFDFKVLAVLASLLVFTLSPTAASHHVARGGVIPALLRHPKSSRFAHRDFHVNLSTCPPGSYACSDGKGCCNVGYDCVVVSGTAGCCAAGSTCGGTPQCQNPSDKLCPGSELCCPLGDQCFPDFTCGSSGGGSGVTSTKHSAFSSTTSTHLVPAPSTTSSRTTSSSSTTTSLPNAISSDAMLTVSNPILVVAVMFVGSLLPFIN